MLRAAGRAQSPGLYRSAMTSRVAAFILLSLGMVQLVTLLSPANVRVSAPLAVIR